MGKEDRAGIYGPVRPELGTGPGGDSTPSSFPYCFMFLEIPNYIQLEVEFFEDF